MRTAAPIVVLVIGLFALSCSQQRGVAPSPVAGAGTSASSTAQSGATSVTTAAAHLPLTAEIQFGRADVGSGYPPPSGHDASFHANDKLYPQTVVIGVGGTVTFTTFGVHEIALYDAGTSPSDINTSLLVTQAGCPPVPFINDPNHRIAVWAPECAGGPTVVTQTFPSAGKYLAICDFLPHFVDAKMYGWIDVK